ncbi:HK97 family phage prohead protease [Nocardia cyriacigeorgica]|uniref:HK97 family phage prohead protease n=1 Tax=Nocardia cyriacigeorgica TaxID=135487 RepID=UPI00030C89C7|nr:HK97 family phage prohead protease [Nocardia cyriacigeorgica]TLF52020.1 HK97 family phage prohead protease [Nocardia cyriacigeorgica]
MPLAGIKTAGLADGEFIGYASVFGNVDAHGDIVQRGAFSKALSSGATVPLIWEHKADDPRNFVGEVVTAEETAEGLQIKGRFDLESDFGAAAYRQVKGRRVNGLSIGYYVRRAEKSAAGANLLLDVDLVEVSVVARGANDRALIGAVKTAADRSTTGFRAALARDALTRYHSDTKGNLMYGNRIQTLTKERDAHLATAKSILDAADSDGRELTADEVQRVEHATAQAKALDEPIQHAQRDAEVYNTAKSLAAEIGEPLNGRDERPADGTGAHLALTGAAAKTLARRIATQMTPQDAKGRKALLPSGSTVTDVPMVAESPFALGRVALSVLDVLTVTAQSPKYSYLRQTLRTNNAAPVADGATKPTSVLGLIEVEAALHVIAHMSEPIPKYWLADAAGLERFVADELLYGLRQALEAQVLNGDGLGDNLTGIANVTGIQTQAFATDLLTTTRAAITKVEVQGHTPGTFVLSPADWEKLELARTDTAGQLELGGPIDRAARKLWGVPVTLSLGLPASTGLLLDLSAADISTDHAGIETIWQDSHADDFAKNQLRARVEGRFEVNVTNPLGVVKIATVATP